MSGLSKDDVQILTRWFDLEDHELKPQYGNEKAKERGHQLWLPYVGEDAVRERLSQVDPGFEFRIDMIQQRNGYFATYATLTVKGVVRQGVGTGSTDEMGEKGAATDALKRCARLFGIGSYLKRSPSLFTDASGSYSALHGQAMAKFSSWLTSAPNSQSSPVGPDVSQNETNDEWLVDEVETIAYIDKNGNPGKRIEVKNGNQRASAWSRQVFTEAGYDTETWAEAGVHKLDVSAWVTIGRNGKFLTIESVRQWSKADAA